MTMMERFAPRFNEAQVVEACARVAHEANRAYCLTLGDASQLPWDATDPEIRESARSGVKLALEGASPEKQHEAWRNHKALNGWRYGAEKNAALRTHPCMVPYAELPTEQRVKDILYGASVNGMADALEIAAGADEKTAAR